MMRKPTFRLARKTLFLALLLLLQQQGVVVQATRVACSSNEQCEAIVRPGSECDEETGFCTNPFYKGGCLANMMEGWHRVRVCGSEDPPEAAALGHCRHSPFDHMEGMSCFVLLLLACLLAWNA